MSGGGLCTPFGGGTQQRLTAPTPVSTGAAAGGTDFRAPKRVHAAAAAAVTAATAPANKSNMGVFAGFDDDDDFFDNQNTAVGGSANGGGGGNHNDFGFEDDVVYD